MAPEIKLDVVFTPGEASLKVAYTVANPGRELVWLLDRMWKYTPTGDLMDHPVGAYLSLGVDGVLSVGRIIHPLPQMALVEQQLVPFARKLGPLQSVSDAFELALPITEYNPYYDKPRPEDQLAKKTTAARFLLSWVPELPGMSVTDAGLGGAKVIDAPTFMEEVRTERTAKIAVVAAARRRTDQFERFA